MPSDKDDGGGQKMKKPSYPAPYTDIKEFFELNPNCCYLTQSYRSKTSIYGAGVSDWDRKTGKRAVVVVVKWNLRYIDNDGLAQAKEYEWGLTQDNCGKIVHEYED